MNAFDQNNIKEVTKTMFVESLCENLEDFCIIRKFKNEDDFMVHYSSQNKQQLINRLRRLADWFEQSL